MRHGRSDYDDRIVDLEDLIPEDEPVFLLRGQDRFAMRALRAYAIAARDAGCPEVGERARRQADRMAEWQARVDPKVPDLPEGALDTMIADAVSSPTADSR